MDVNVVDYRSWLMRPYTVLLQPLESMPLVDHIVETCLESLQVAAMQAILRSLKITGYGTRSTRVYLASLIMKKRGYSEEYISYVTGLILAAKKRTVKGTRPGVDEATT